MGACSHRFITAAICCEDHETVEVVRAVEVTLALLCDPLAPAGRIVDSLLQPCAPPPPMDIQLRIPAGIQVPGPGYCQLGVCIENVGGEGGWPQLQRLVVLPVGGEV